MSQDVEYLSDVARLVNDRLPDNSGFIVMVAPFGDGGRLRYASNMTRETAINVLKEWLIKASGEEE